MRVLVVEDDDGIAAGLRINLQQRGYVVDICESVAKAWASLRVEPVDLILLDLGLVDGDGTDLLKRIRSAPSSAPASAASDTKLPDPKTPVLIMTARDRVADRITGLDLGADDYLTKPFDVDELEARMRASLRRAAGRAHSVIEIAGLSIDPSSHTVSRDGQSIDISAKEFAVLMLLLQSQGTVMSRQRLEERLYNWDQSVGSNTVEVHIHHLRKKLGSDLIQTMRGVGYFIARDVSR